MMFCTRCATPLSSDAAICAACGGAQPAPEVIPAATAPDERRRRVGRALRLAPLVVLFALGGALIERELSERAWLDSAYAAAATAEQAGNLVAARDAFAAIPGFRDARERADHLATVLEPQEAQYAAGRDAMRRGDYAAAVTLLEPVAATAPSLGDVTIELADARRLLSLDLRHTIDAAVSIRDWTGAEQDLRRLATLDPLASAPRAELAALQREHGPLLAGHNRELWLMSPEGSRETPLASGSQVIWPAWSPDRDQIAFLAPDPTDDTGNLAMYLTSVSNDAPRLIGQGVSGHAAPAWSPDATRIAYTSFAGYDAVEETGSISVRVVDLTTGIEQDLTGSRFELAFNPAWAPDGQRLAFVAKDISNDGRPQHAPGDVYVYDFATGQIENLTRGRVDDIWSVAWSPRDDRLLLFSLYGQTWYEPPSTALRELDLATDTLAQVSTRDDHSSAPVWSPDGVRYAFTTDETAITIAGPDGGQQSVETNVTLSGDLTWSPDGSALLATPWDIQSPSVMVDLSGRSPTITTVDLDFDSTPPFVSPPQWASSAPVAPASNLSLPPAPQDGSVS